MKKKINNGVFYVVIPLVAILAIGVVAYGFTGNISGNNFEGDCIDCTLEAPDVQSQPGEVTLGASPGPNRYARFFSDNGVRYAPDSGTLRNGTTTLLSILNPYGSSATSTVELIKLEITGVATSSAIITCGSAAYNGANGSPALTYTLLTSDTIATSTGLGFIENNLSSSYTKGSGGGTVAKVMLDSGLPYFNCIVTDPLAGTYGLGAFTEDSNTFTGKYKIRFTQ